VHTNDATLTRNKGLRVRSFLERFLDRSGVVNLRSISSASTLERQRRKYRGVQTGSPNKRMDDRCPESENPVRRIIESAAKLRPDSALAISIALLSPWNTRLPPRRLTGAHARRKVFDPGKSIRLPHFTSASRWTFSSRRRPKPKLSRINQEAMS